MHIVYKNMFCVIGRDYHHHHQTHHHQEWESPFHTAAWRSGGHGPSPFKRKRIPLLKVPGFDDRRYVLLDFCHIFHLGYGLDIAASTIVLLAKKGQYGLQPKFDDRLAEAYKRFNSWCHRTGRTSSLNEFSARKFGMTQQYLGIANHGGFPFCLKVFFLVKVFSCIEP